MRKNPPERARNAFAIASAESSEKPSAPVADSAMAARCDLEEIATTVIEGGDGGRDNVDEMGRGSDSEGDEWKIWYVDSDDDSGLDSNKAPGESDEKRFADFTFRGYLC